MFDIHPELYWEIFIINPSFITMVSSHYYVKNNCSRYFKKVAKKEINNGVHFSKSWLEFTKKVFTKDIFSSNSRNSQNSFPCVCECVCVHACVCVCVCVCVCLLYCIPVYIESIICNCLNAKELLAQCRFKSCYCHLAFPQLQKILIME